jgi:aminoglycoside phosphotransferase
VDLQSTEPRGRCFNEGAETDEQRSGFADSTSTLGRLVGESDVSCRGEFRSSVGGLRVGGLRVQTPRVERLCRGGMQPLRHSYTNDTRGDGRIVVKRYEGPDAAVRRSRERATLSRLQGRLTVPAVLGDARSDELRMAFVDGVHGQELIEAGMARAVLRACGRTLHHIHHLDIGGIFPDQMDIPGSVVVHGDYGPNNVLLDPGTLAITAVLDWEWAHPGQPVEDVAWCEWIIRMHHGAHVDQLGEFFDAYGPRPSWEERREAMLTRCQQLLDLCRRSSVDAAQVWQQRLQITARWAE